MNKPLINNQIRAKEVRLIAENGEQLGVIATDKALQMARDKGLDLIQVTEKVEPPVTKIGDYGKYLYSLQKKERKASGGTKGGEVKIIRLTVNISDNDIETRAAAAEKFLKKGDKVKVDLRLKGRQNALAKVGEEKIQKFLESVGKKIEIKIEKEVKKEMKSSSMIISKK
ncbi:MAG: translation initiation factor IF-3 [Candidatus Pacebacteria bacterium]|nr:translation initiation factor IF-3 [Candidatus Paceibacterota bacterium]